VHFDVFYVFLLDLPPKSQKSPSLFFFLPSFLFSVHRGSQNKKNKVKDRETFLALDLTFFPFFSPPPSVENVARALFFLLLISLFLLMRPLSPY